MAPSSDPSSHSFANELSPGAVYLYAVREDLHKAAKLKALLEREGIKAWFPGEEPERTEKEALERLEACSVFLPILTSQSVEDAGFADECLLALKLLDECPEDAQAIQICPVKDSELGAASAKLLGEFELRNILYIDSVNGDLQEDDLEVVAQLYDRWHQRRIAEESEGYSDGVSDSGGKVYAGKSIDPQAGELVDLLRENEQEKTAAISLLSEEELAEMRGDVVETPDVSFGQDAGESEPAAEEETEDASPVATESPAPVKEEEEEKPFYPPESVQFTTYRPKHLQTEVWTPLLVFTHLDDKPAGAPAETPHPMEEVQEQAERILGGSARDYHQITKDSQMAIPREAEISLVPRVYGVQFNPPERRFFWAEGVQVHREEFGVRALAEMAGQPVNGTLTVYLGGIILAELPLRFEVSEQAQEPEFEPSDSVQPYRRVFASYSRDDLNVVKQLENYALAMGDRYLRDLTELRAGEDWDSRLQEMIEEADVFQLFWSERSAASQAVEREWRHAMSLDRKAFVRPTYWEEPMPQPPEELAVIHFQRLGLEMPKPVVMPSPSPAPVRTPEPTPTSSPMAMPEPDVAEDKSVEPEESTSSVEAASAQPSLGKPMRPPPGKEPAKEPPPDWRRGAGTSEGEGSSGPPVLNKPSSRATRAKAQPWRSGDTKARTGTTAKVQLAPEETAAKSDRKPTSIVALVVIILVSILVITGSVLLLMR